MTRFDLLRGYSGAEKLAFPTNIRRFVSSEAKSVLHTLIGCPAEIFEIIGKTLCTGRRYRLQEIDSDACQLLLDPFLDQLRNWDPMMYSYPNEDSEWPLLADAYRHTALLRVLRFPDTFAIPCSDGRIRASVTAILDAAAQVSRQSPYFKRFLFPLFVAGAETESPHQQQYVAFCIDHIRTTTGFSNESLDELLRKTWADRKASDGTINVPWFEYVRAASLYHLYHRAKR